MKILFRSTAFLIVFFLFSFFSIHPLSISSCDRLYIYSEDTTYHNSVSLNCLFSGPAQKKGWIFFQGPSYISPRRIQNISNDSVITIDTTRFPIGDYHVQCMTMSGHKPVFSNWHPFTIVSEKPIIAIQENPNQNFTIDTPHLNFSCTSNQPLQEAYLVCQSQKRPLQSDTPLEWTFNGILPLQDGVNTIQIIGKNLHYVPGDVSFEVVYNKPAFADRIFVLGYHNIGESVEKWEVSPKTFEKHLQYLQENNYYFCTPTELLWFQRQKKSLPQKTVLITFDDGCKGVYTYALPLLQKYKAKATLFIVNSFLNTDGYLTWEELDSIMSSGIFTLGSHSYNLHGWVDYSMISGGGMVPKMFHLREESWDEYLNRVTTDLKKSRNELFNRYQQPILFFAYPFGQYNQQTIKRVRECGFIGAFTFNKSERFVTTSSFPFSFDRIPITENTDLAKILELE